MLWLTTTKHQRDSVAVLHGCIQLNWVNMSLLTGVELNVTFQYLDKSVSLDFLGYQYDIGNQNLRNKLKLIAEHKEGRLEYVLKMTGETRR
jgi:hypothetical protein